MSNDHHKFAFPTFLTLLKWRVEIEIEVSRLHFLFFCVIKDVWRGPGLGGPCLRKSTDSSQARGSVPIAARPSVHCVPVIARALGRIKAEGTHKERSQTRVALAQDVFPSVQLTETPTAPAPTMME